MSNIEVQIDVCGVWLKTVGLDDTHWTLLTSEEARELALDLIGNAADWDERHKEREE